MTAVPAGLAEALRDRYRLDRELGQGGMATVYLARDLKHDRDVALKVLRPQLAALLGRDRFLAEIHLTARLDHPHIVTLIDSGENDGFLWYVVPYIRGESLRQMLDHEPQLSVDQALAITKQVASALEYAHRHGVIHRDVKPENILLHEGEAMLADFGIALAVKQAGANRLTETGLSLGTPQYMSPEQALGERELDARSDVYGLGCVLYEALAGEPPYAGPTPQALIAKQLTEPVPSVRRLRSAVPPGVERALMKALAQLPADRFASVAAFAEALTLPAPVGSRPPSIAVLPFLNLSPDPENEYFADGITEDVIAQLSKIRALRVISRTSVMQFKKREQGLREIAARLDVSTLLEGSVRRVGDRVRIVAQLIDAPADQHLWAATYDRQLTDIFAIQADVALHIAAALKAELSPGERTRIHREPTSDLQAYQLYLQGRHCFIRYTHEGLRKAIAYFEQAIDRDPDYALAYAGVALAYGELAEIGALSSDEAYVPAKVAAAKALALDSELAEAHSVLAVLRFVGDFEWTGAEQEFQRALELNPSGADTYNYYGRMLSALERYDEALAAQQRAHELDPLAHPMDLATALLRAGRYAEAAEAATRGIEFNPSYARGHATRGWAYLKQGLGDAGLADLERAVALSPGDSLWLAQLGQAYALVGRVGQAREVLRQLEERSCVEYVSPYHMAYVYTGLGEQDQAIDWLERAHAERAGAVYGIKGSFLFATLRSHPRFKPLLMKMNLA